MVSHGLGRTRVKRSEIEVLWHKSQWSLLLVIQLVALERREQHKLLVGCFITHCSDIPCNMAFVASPRRSNCCFRFMLRLEGVTSSSPLGSEGLCAALMSILTSAAG